MPNDRSDDLELSATWSIWSDFVLRSAGFPFARVDTLRASELAEVVHEILALEDEVCEALRRRIGKSQSRPVNRRCHKTLERIERGEDLAVELARLAEHPELESAYQHHGRAVELGHRLVEVWSRSMSRLHDALSEEANEKSLREATTWQNRRVSALVRRNLGGKPRRAREAERVLAKYLQRYCAKNDSAGFYGPVVWGRIEDREDVADLTVGDRVAVGCRAFLEHWAVDAAGELAAKAPEVRRAMPPRLHPLFSCHDGKLWGPAGEQAVPDGLARLLELVNGERSAAEVVSTAADTFATEQEAWDALEGAARGGMLIWGCDLPTDGSPFERHLRKRMESVKSPEARKGALALLDQLEEHRDAALRARGRPEEVEAALAALDSAFESATGKEATRHHGKTYGMRTLVSLQCRRDLDLVLGRPFLDALSPLSMLLDSIRWMSFHVARAYREEAGSIYRRISEQIGSRDVPLMRFWLEVSGIIPALGGRYPSAVEQVMLDFRNKWEAILDVTEGQSRIELDSAALAPKVAEAFRVVGAGFPNATTHSPDVMIAAASREALEANDFLLVLGEIHPFVLTCEQEVLAHEHPDPPKLRAALREAFPDGRLFPSTPRVRARRHGTFPLGGDERDVIVELPDGRSSWSRDKTLAVSEVVVREEGDLLMFRERGGERTWNAASLLTLLPSISLFFHERRHSPRVTIDRLVISREQWRLPAEELAFASLHDPKARFLGARRWMRRLGIPTRAFCKAPSEPKPTYLDFDSPHLVEVFCRAIAAEKGDALICVSEMLPAREHLWLPDSDDARYTSELRVVVRDRLPPVTPEHRTSAE